MSQSSQYHLNLIELFNLHINEISYSIRHFWIILFYFILWKYIIGKNKFTYEILTQSVKTPPLRRKKIDSTQVPTDPQLTFFIDNDIYVSNFNILAIPKVDLTRTPFTVSDYVETVSIGKIQRNFELFKRYRNVIIYKQQVKAMQPFSRHRWVLE